MLWLINILFSVMRNPFGPEEKNHRRKTPLQQFMATTDDRVQSLTSTCHQFAARLWTSDLPELNSAKYPHVSPHRTAGRFHAFCRSGWFCFSPTRPSSHTGETLTSQPDGENEPGSNQGRLLFSSSALHLCMCVCLLSHTHMLMCGLTVIQWTAGSSSSGGQGSYPRRRSSDSEGVFPGDAPGDETAGLLNLVLISGPCCCFMNPLLHTSTQPEQPFVILIVHL